MVDGYQLKKKLPILILGFKEKKTKLIFFLFFLILIPFFFLLLIWFFRKWISFHLY